MLLFISASWELFTPLLLYIDFMLLLQEGKAREIDEYLMFYVAYSSDY